jgi:putative copper resistance protein D
VLVLVAMVPDTVVGIVLLQSSKVSFPLMFSMHPSWAPDALSDQQIAGGLMWAAGDGLMMLIGIGVVIMMIADPQRKRVLGHWLESARSNTLDEHLVNSGGAVRADSGADVDDDESTLDAYNAMLARLSDQG